MTERFKCTKESPWTPDKGKAYHPEAILICDEYDQTSQHNDYEVYKCPNCELVFEVTIAN